MLDWNTGLQEGLAQQDAWLGEAELCGAGDWPCCSIARAGADGPGGLKLRPGLWVVWQETKGVG